jgi:hypothetical protein
MGKTAKEVAIPKDPMELLSELDKKLVETVQRTGGYRSLALVCNLRDWQALRQVADGRFSQMLSEKGHHMTCALIFGYPVIVSEDYETITQWIVTDALRTP